jgi:hypothetical protein
LPDETGQLLARWSGAWKILTGGVLLAVLGLPFFVLLPERTKRSRPALAAIAGCILAGLLGERFLLVLPSLEPGADALSVLVSLGAAAGVLGLFALGFGARLEVTRASAAQRAE